MKVLELTSADTPYVYVSLLEGVRELERARRHLLDRQPPYPRWVVWGMTLYKIYTPFVVLFLIFFAILMGLLPQQKRYLGFTAMGTLVALTGWVLQAESFTWQIPILSEEKQQGLREGLGAFALRRDVVSQFIVTVERLRTRVIYGRDKELLQQVEDLHREVLDLRDFASDPNVYRGMKLLKKNVPHYDGSAGPDDDTRADHWYEELAFTLSELERRARKMS